MDWRLPYTYDCNLKRVKQVVGGDTIYSIYDSAGALVTQQNITQNQTTDYLSVGSQTLVRVKNGVESYPINDHLGSAYRVADRNGSVAASQRFNYTPFGETLGAGPGANTEQGFTGHVEDRTGLVYMQARFYDPAIGRVLQTDPIGYEDQTNLYAYVHNNPVSLYDPFGLRSNCRPMADTVGTSCSYIGQASTTTSEQVDNERAREGSGRWEVRYGPEGSASHFVYNQTVTVVDRDGNVLGTFEGSSTPNPFKPRDATITGTDAYPQVQGGTYDLTHGAHRGEPALSVNGDGFVPTTAPNPNFPSQGSTANLIRVHSGYSDTWKGSAGCLTVNPAQWDSFIGTVPSTGSGILVIP